MTERNKITDLGENINTLFICNRGIWGMQPQGPTLLKRRGGKSQEKAQAVHKSEATGGTAEGQGP